MADDGVGREPPAAAPRSAGDPIAAVVQEILSVIPAGCTWLLPVLAGDRQVVDFRIAATSDRGHDIYGRGVGQVDGSVPRGESIFHA
jgi:hypothetical protein